VLLAVTPSPIFASGKFAVQGPKPGTAPVLVFETEKGTFEIETYPQHAPKTVAHLVSLVQKRFYNGQRLHRVIKDFVVQFGDPQSRDMTKKADWGKMGSGRPIGVAEFGKGLKHAIGIVSMAHPEDPLKADSQLFIVIGKASHLDGVHQIVGRVTGNGMSVVNKLAVPDRIIRATVK